MKIFFLFLLLSVSIYGCAGSPFRYLQAKEMLENKYISFIAPDSTWEIAKDFETAIYRSRGNPDVLQKNGFIRLNNNPSGVKYDLDIITSVFEDNYDPAFFDKNAKFPAVSKNEDMRFTKNDKEQGIYYKRVWTTYVAGMKCLSKVFSRGRGGYLSQVNNKNYSTLCAYYHKSEGRRLIRIAYRYNYGGNSIRLEKDKSTLQDELMTLDQAELLLKQAVKKVADSLYIKGFDKERMQLAGLYYPEKSFKISPY